MDTPLICIIGNVWPEPGSSAAGVRMMQLIHSFLNNGYKVAFASAALHSEYEANLEIIGVSTVSIALNNDSFNEFIKALQPDYVLFDRFMVEEQFGWRVSEHVPNAIKILDTEDLHFLRYARQQAHIKNKTIDILDLQSDIAKREIASIFRCDLSLIISKYEYDLLLETFNIPATLLCYLPIWFEPNIQKTSDFDSRKDFMFIGNFFHEPNRQAVFYLKEKLWPLLQKKLPQASLHIYGAYVDAKIQALHHPSSRFLIKGRAEDVQEVMQHSRVCLAPLFFGAGLKGKLLDAMQSGTPSITTMIGAEGISTKEAWPGFVCDDLEEMVEKSILLYSDKTVWEHSVQTGKNLLNQQFSRLRFEPNWIEILAQIKLSLIAHRQQNFIGLMLQHHTLHSARYLSKYIMAKNKKAEV